MKEGNGEKKIYKGQGVVLEREKRGCKMRMVYLVGLGLKNKGNLLAQVITQMSEHLQGSQECSPFYCGSLSSLPQTPIHIYIGFILSLTMVVAE